MRNLTLDQSRLVAKAVLEACYPKIAGQFNGSIDSLPDWGRAELERHLTGRLNEFRETYVPWLNRHMLLENCRILEIGAGTGSSTIALAEQGAHVHGIDIDPKALKVAQMRCECHGIDTATFQTLNAIDIDSLGQAFDLVIFFATFEHMTYEERKAALAKAWNITRSGGFVAIVECPNRLWYFDVHTTLMPFYHWLPDDLAMDYSRFVDRQGFREEFASVNRGAAQAERLARWGRGASYHDIEIVLGPVEALDVREGLADFRRIDNEDLDGWWEHSQEGQFRKLLLAFEPRVPSAFFYPWLDVLIRKT